MRFALSTVSALAVASVALGQEYPDPNPVPQADGTNLWYVGNNTQYPVIQDVLDAISDGDEVVVREGLYVESLHIDNSDVENARDVCSERRAPPAPEDSREILGRLGFPFLACPHPIRCSMLEPAKCYVLVVGQ